MPKTLRRRIQTVSNTLGIRRTKIKSLSKNDGTEWTQYIDTETGIMRCDCPAYMYSKRHTCKHLQRAIGVAERSGDVVGGCYKCHSTFGLHGLADDQGEPIVGVFICRVCVYEMQKAAKAAEPAKVERVVLPRLVVGGKAL